MSDLDLVVHHALTARCDPGRMLKELVRLLDDANLHELDDEDDDAVYDRVTSAKARLFCIATEWRAYGEAQK